MDFISQLPVVLDLSLCFWIVTDVDKAKNKSRKNLKAIKPVMQNIEAYLEPSRTPMMELFHGRS